MENTDRQPLVEVLRLMAKLYYFMGKEIIDTLGKEEGEKIIKRAMWNYGSHRGKLIRNAVDEKGLDANFINMDKYYDMPLTSAWDKDVELTPQYFNEVVRYCPFAETWSELGAEELGMLYCEQDMALIKAFNEDSKISREQNIMKKGDTVCNLIGSL